MRYLRFIFPTLLAALFTIWLYRSTEPVPAAAKPVVIAAPSPPPQINDLVYPEPAPPPATVKQEPIKATVAIPLANDYTVLNFIEAAATDPTPASLLQIAAYLNHESANVRAAARDGLLRLKDPDAAPLLREAALYLNDPNEIRGLIATAKFIENPTPPPMTPAAKASSDFSRKTSD
jgi:hypothetical protein